MVLGLLLARAGIDVTVLEKHGDFLRDFRGDTVHPSTLQLLDELGLGERFAALPQNHLHRIAFPIDADTEIPFANFDRLKVRHPYVAMVPQWDLLNLLAEAGREEPAYTLRMRAEVTSLLKEDGRVAGVRLADGEEIRADLTVACDGRWSLARQQADLKPKEFSVPIDVWWFSLPREPGDDLTALMPRTGNRQMAVIIPREGHLQLAFLLEKGTDTQLRARGIEAFRRDIAELIPPVAGRVDQLSSMDDVKHLDVRLNRLKRWHVDGLLCIGDAAHAMSPVGGVGINLAIQDAVAAATLLAEPLKRGRVRPSDLARVRRRRLLPTILVQLLQRAMHRALLGPIVQGRRSGPPKPVLALMRNFPPASFVPAYLVGVGFRPEHAPPFARRQPSPSRRS